MKIPVALPYYQGDHDRIQKAPFNLPVGKIPVIDQAAHKRNNDAKERDQYQPEPKVIDFIFRVGAGLWFCYVRPLLFHIRSLCSWKVKIRQ